MDTGVKHAVSGSAYTKARTAAFMGLSLILQSVGISREAIKRYRATHPELDDAEVNARLVAYCSDQVSATVLLSYRAKYKAIDS